MTADGVGQEAATEPEQRPAFAALVVRCLLPRLRKRSGRHAPLRSASLAWLGRLDPVGIFDCTDVKCPNHAPITPATLFHVYKPLFE